MIQMKKSPQLKKLNISSETVQLRLREMSELHKVGMSMEGAKWIGKIGEGAKVAVERFRERTETKLQ